MTAGVMETIGTHNGTFHCDEALACFMLRTLPRFSKSPITRSRDPQVLSTLSIVVDVGDVYDPTSLRFDHHQRGFDQTFSPNHKTKLSSAGLIYKHFGREVISSIAPGLTPTDNEIIFNKVYDLFIEGIDGIDNGMAPYRCSDEHCSAGVTRCYSVDTDVSARVGRLNAAWNENLNDEEMEKRFVKAMALVGSEFQDRVSSYAFVWLPGRQIVYDAIKTRMQYDAEGRLVVFDQYCPWKDHLFTIEKEMSPVQPILYVVYPEYSNTWRIQAVPVHNGSFTSRLGLSTEWRGIRDSQLSQVSGIDGCIFVHNSGFIGGNKTRDGAIQMAKRSMEMQLTK